MTDENSRLDRFVGRRRDGYQSERAEIEEWVADRGALVLIVVVAALVVGGVLSIFHAMF
jgi:hypothetical protein